VQSGVQTFSAYVKKGTLNWVRIRVNATTTAQAYFDLENGVAGSTESGLIKKEIESIGSGWYRCSITFNSTSSVARIYPATGDNNTTQSSGNILIQDAQLEQGLVATDVITTTTSSVTVGITDDLPRVDYSGGGCPSLLLEPSRNNLVTQSEYFDAWANKIDVTLDFGYPAPDGTNSAYKVINTGAQAHIADNFGGLIVSGVYKSIWAKTTIGS